MSKIVLQLLQAAHYGPKCDALLLMWHFGFLLSFQETMLQLIHKIRFVTGFKQ